MVISAIPSDQAKARFFQFCLDVRSPADAWFTALPQTTQEDWGPLEAQFITDWGPSVMLVKTDAEKEKDLLNHPLKLEDVGKMVPYRGDQKYTHIIWADEILMRA
jgi:hypothetical protein